ncbi:MAG: flagellar motor rotation protein MotB [Flavipsychrobacter sp.]|nr:flagellar motor rotation protein MotB [Flavipsychrobacter sp.]
MNFKHVAFLGLSSLMIVSCTSSKKLKQSEARYSSLDSLHRAMQLDLAKCQENRADNQNRIKSLQDQVSDLKSANANLQKHMDDLSVITGAQATSINKSLDNIGVKDAYIGRLQSALNRKDSMNMALVINLKSAIGNLDDKDVNIKVDKGVVYVDISDKLLFKSGSYDVTDRAQEILGKVAKVLVSQPDVEFMVEGHTDNVAFTRGVLEDNWDLSVKRATSVVRILNNKYHVPPARMTAAGRAEFVPVASNDSKEGQAANRRTRIVILPQLDQFFKILEKPQN